MPFGKAGLRLRSIGLAQIRVTSFFFLVNHLVVMGLFNNAMEYIDKMILIFIVVVVDGRLFTSSNISHHMKLGIISQDANLSLNYKK